MAVYEVTPVWDEELGELVAWCPECDGTGKGDAPEYSFLEDVDDADEYRYCPVCCGFGRLDW